MAELSDAYKASRSSRTAPVKGNVAPSSSASLLAGARASAPVSIPQPVEKPKEWWEQAGDVVHHVAETPVIKQILDALSFTTYAAGNAANDAADVQKRINEGKDISFNDALTLSSGPVAGIEGMAKGILGGLGNTEYQKTSGPAISKLQALHGIDPESPESRAVAGWGGYAADAASGMLVPGAGAAPSAIKGAVRGATAFKGEKALANAAKTDLAAGVKNTRWENAKAEAAVDVAKYRELQATKAQVRETNRQTRKLTDEQKATYLVENISSLKDAVAKAVVGKGDQKLAILGHLAEKAADAPTEVRQVLEKLTSTGTKQAAKTVEEAANVSRPLQPSVGLGAFKKPTKEEDIWDKLSALKVTNKKPVYDAKTVKNVEEALVAKPHKIEEQIPGGRVETGKQVYDVDATIASIRAYDKEMGGGMKIPVTPLMGGKKIYMPAEDFINTLKDRVKDPQLFKHNWDQLDESFKPKVAETKPAPPRTVSKANPNALKVEDYQKLGVQDAHIPLIQGGTSIRDITDNVSATDIGSIIEAIRRGDVPKKAVEQFYEATGKTDKNEVADAIKAITGTPEFKATAKEMEKYGSVRRGETPAPTLGVSGHGRLATPGKGATAEDILASRTAASADQTRAFLDAKYTENALNLSSHPLGAELRVKADEIFERAVGLQREPAGPLVMKGGASAPETLNAAKYERKYNTHSGLNRMSEIIMYARSLEKAGKTTNRNQMDDVIMTMMKDVDSRLQLAGFDQHLSNMQITGDKLVVRLSPSDVLGVLTRTDRINYIWGNKAFKGRGAKSMPTISEFMPSTILDIGEILLRSATKLTHEGTLDMEALKNAAIHTLQGTYSKVASGKRVIINNLDANTAYKNDLQILEAMDKRIGNGSTLVKQYQDAKTLGERTAVIDNVSNTHSGLFKEVSELRMDKVTLDLFNRFMKNDMAPIRELVNLNMRNASLMGGTVAKKVNEASAAHSAKVLEALENGTVGDYLSALVSRPPFKTSDPAVQAVLKENKEAIQLSAATTEEISHAEALNKNVDGLPADGPKHNAEAYQKEPLMTEELAKPLDEMNTEKMFDLAIREANKDILFRMYGIQGWFNKRMGMPISFETINGSLHASNLLMTGFHEILRDLRRKGYTKEQLRNAFNQLKEGPPADQIAAEVNGVLSAMFDTNKVNFLTRNSVGPEHFNKILESVKFDEQFRIPVDAERHEMMNAWKKWDVTDVEDFFSKMMGAMVKTAEDVSMGSSFSKHFGVSTPQKGYTKVFDTAVGKERNPFIDVIDQNLYYPEELTKEFVHIGRLMTESRSFKPGTGLHTFITKIMDPIVSNLKMTQTTLKPGHHVMSITGDGWRNNLALTTIGVINPIKQLGLYGESARILWSSVGDIEELSAFQKFQRSQGLTNELKLAKQGKGESEFYGNIKGGGRISHKDMYALMQANGIALPAHLGGMAEDYLADFDSLGMASTTRSKILNKTSDLVGKVTAGLDRLANPIKPKFGMKNPYSLNKFTANRDTWTRGALFLGAMRSRNFKSVEEAVKYSSEFVHKWAPTAADLGAVESKYLRRGIFYYTWIRGMVPRIVESTLMHPGVATLPSKTMYDMAYANGLDPASIGDPFPPGKLYPDWYTERVIGPQWQANGDLWGINPTGPLGDVLNSLGSNIKPKDFLTGDSIGKTAGTIANMSTPWIKAPTELAFGRTLERGIPIDDRAQYLQDMIGPSRTLSRATGKETYLAPGPNGLAVPNRTESKYRRGMTPEQTAANAGPEFINYMLGLGLTNYTSDQAEKSAQFQKKDELVKAKKDAQRFQ